MLADLEILNRNFLRYYMYTAEYHRRKKLQVDPALLPLTIVFSSNKRPEQLDRPSLYQFFYIFDYTAISNSQTPRSSFNPLIGHFPFFRKGVPMGQPVLLTNDEYRGVMADRETHEMKWKRHIEKLNTKKKPENGRYEIKTPIPSNPDRCFVCNINIPPEEEYREHL